MDARIQQSVVATLLRRPAPVESGPFVIGVDPGTDSPHINYATPRPDVTITAADVTTLVTAFRAARRKPRLEYVTSAAPGLEALLLAAGFTVEARQEYLVCVPGSLVVPSTPEGYHLREPTDDAERIALTNAQHEAFGLEPVATAADAERMARLQAAGGVAVIAVAGACPGSSACPDSSACAGGGMAVAPNDGVSEVAGIAVRERYRRQGLAGAVTAEITGTLFERGVRIAWLEASGAGSWRVYERVGYRPAGRRLYLSLD